MSNNCAYRTCNRCKYAEWDYVDAYYGGYWGICGCNMPINAPITDTSLLTKEELEKMGDDWDDDWGDEKDCPFFVEEDRNEK